jgi:hypothetical protein
MEVVLLWEYADTRKVNGMDVLTKSDLRALVINARSPCVSLYLPTHRAGAETLQDPIRLKNLLREAEQKLEAAGLPSSDAEELLKPARALLEDYDFWQHQGDGLAIFSSPDLFRTYRLQLRVPELAIAADSFHLKPLLPLITENGHYFILALSQSRARLFRATRDSISEMAVPRMPASLTEALEGGVAERQLQHHSAAAGRQTAILHGQGGGEEDRKDMLLSYFRQVDEAVQDVLWEDRMPVVLATVDYLFPIYRQASSNLELLEDWVSGNPDNLTPQELHEMAAPIASAHFRKTREKAADEYLQLWYTQRASNTLEEVLPAAWHGRVRHLFVAKGTQIWGRFNPATSETAVSDQPAPQDQDLLNLAAIDTFLAGGTVYAVPQDEVPGRRHVAAVFRY